MEDKLTREYKEAFAMYDRKKEGKIATKDLGTVLRSLGRNPTEAEVKALAAEVDKGNKGFVAQADFLTLAAKKSSAKPQTEDQIKAAFKAFDKDGNGFVSASDLRHALTSLGEKFTQAEVDEVIRVLDVDSDGQVNYEQLVHAMVGITTYA